MKLTFNFSGVTKGALGVSQRFTVQTEGATIKDCFLSLYDSYEHIGDVTVIHNGIPMGFNWDDYTLNFTSTYSHLGYEKVTTDNGSTWFFTLNSEGLPTCINPAKIAQLEMVRMGGFK